MHLFYAKTIADDLLSQLSPFCEIIHIAGSVRRQKEEVKDIEIVCIPQKFTNNTTDLFDVVVSTTSIVHPGFDKVIRSLGTVIKGKTSGRYMQVELQKTIEAVSYSVNIDFFMPQAHDYYRQLAIRTGSAEYSKRFIAIPWVKKGWCGTEQGLRKINECYKISETKWIMKKEFIDRPTLPPVWESEKAFFAWLGVQYLDPPHRSL